MATLTLAKEVFPSITAMLDANNTRPNNEHMSGKRSSVDTYDKTWSGSESYDAAESLFLSGWGDKLDRIKAEYIRQTAHIRNTEQVNRAVTRHDVVGSTANVGRYMSGHPRHMRRNEQVQLPSKTIHLTYLFGVACNKSNEDIIKAGITVISAVATLEKMGYRVRLDVATMVSNGDNGDWTKGIFGGFVAKDYRQPLDLLKLAFPVAHPSMFRRIGFRFMETTPVCNARYVHYGRPLESLTDKERREWKAHLNAETGSTCIQMQDAMDASYDAVKLLSVLGVTK